MDYSNNARASIREISEHFSWTQITGNDESLNRWVIVPDVNRPGLELAGYFKHSEPKRIVVLGDKEESYINQMEEHIQRERFEFLTDGYTPCIVLTKGRKCPAILKEIAERTNFPVFITQTPSYRALVNLVSYLDEKLAPVDNIHGVLLNVHGTGVMIIGESGMGKSEITLELISKGHILVADDRVDVSRVHNKIMGQPPEILKGMLEIRGIGVIDVEKMFGVSSVLHKEEVQLVISLQKFNENTTYDRVGIEEDKFYNILDIDIPMTILPVKEGRSMGVLVESAVKNYKLKNRGFDSAKEFEQRVLDFIKAQQGE